MKSNGTRQEELRLRYRELCRGVANILTGEDPVGIIPGNPDPEDEYAGEAAEIVRRLSSLEAPDAEIPNRLAGIVAEVFRREFEEDIDSDLAERIASRVLTVNRDLEAKEIRGQEN